MLPSKLWSPPSLPLSSLLRVVVGLVLLPSLLAVTYTGSTTYTDPTGN